MIESAVIGNLKRIFDLNQCVGGRYLSAEKHTIRKRVYFVYVDALFPSQQIWSCQDGTCRTKLPPVYILVHKAYV